ncbi:MAG TPA: 3-hydroxyacyl-CoA dehydrogenase [Geminicoccus sp.]|uniref:3-hydroxyacyl-CoA dehydrogenase n=1 Tax=Geminicoccus sp. TaxID=2024832 RepID=UPI002BEDE646|nr:3-hydroxyacyl-CoA dehydrogenase [Geminicoccus sp.]HWL71746.1 3-hydroxyacyl-CoA dehydrogenase [Geminicoccus sp.]
MAEKVAIVGCGLVGRGWAVAFARGGWDVAMWDPVEGAAEKSLELARTIADDLHQAGLLQGQQPAEVLARIRTAPDLATALDGAAWMQESAPEKLDVKQELWRELDRLAPATAVLGSSTSALVPSSFTEGLPGKERCLVSHPLNPPHLIPCVELVPAPWTSPATMRRAVEVMAGIGQKPVVMGREIDGFVVNRLQGALMEEGFRLVADGFAGPEDVDAAVKHGLALRWSFMGPFETIDLNAPGGIADYIARFQHMYREMHVDQQRRVDWEAPEVLQKVLADRRARLPLDKLAERSRWRDRRLMALLRQKQASSQEIGD